MRCCLLICLAFTAAVADVAAQMPQISGVGRQNQTVTSGTAVYVSFPLPALEPGVLAVLGPGYRLLFSQHTTDPALNVTSWPPLPGLQYDESGGPQQGRLSFTIESVQREDAGLYSCFFLQESTRVIYSISDCGVRLRVRNCILHH